MGVAWALTGGTLAAAQQGTELGIEAVTTFSDPALAMVGGYGAIRASERTRLSGLLGAGVSRSDLAWRGEAVAHFLVSPEKRRGWGVYLGGGLAAVGGPVERGYLVLGLGIEERPATNGGWVAEAGLGGGVRLAVGYRWRRLRPGL